MTTKTIDATPTWEGILPLLLELHLRNHTDNHIANRRFVMSQFYAMAQAADKWNAHVASTQTKEG